MKKGWSTANHPFCGTGSAMLPLAEHILNTLSKPRKDHTVKDIIQPSEKQATYDDSNNHRYCRINVAFPALTKDVRNIGIVTVAKDIPRTQASEASRIISLFCLRSDTITVIQAA